MKICVYGLVHNVGDRAIAWINHIQNADYIILGDTGSTDGSLAVLEHYGAKIYNIRINPWRYDIARNTLLSLIPEDTDIAIALDYNQTLSSDWKNILLEHWLPDTTKVKVKHKLVNNDCINVNLIHTPFGLCWTNPVYESLSLSLTDQIVSCDNITITDEFEYKWGDIHQLLTTAVNENPKNNEMVFRLGHYYATIAEWKKSIDTHKQNLENNHSELYRSESMIHLSGLEHLMLPYWLAQAVVECPWRRETWYELACYYYRQHEWNLCLSHCIKSLSLSGTRPISESTEKNLIVQLHDMAAMSAWNSNMLEKSLEHAEIAANLDPNDPRLHSNLAIIRNIINSAKQNGGHV